MPNLARRGLSYGKNSTFYTRVRCRFYFFILNTRMLYREYCIHVKYNELATIAEREFSVPRRVTTLMFDGIYTSCEHEHTAGKHTHTQMYRPVLLAELVETIKSAREEGFILLMTVISEIIVHANERLFFSSSLFYTLQ